MLYLIKNEWRKVRFPVLATTILLSIVLCILSGVLSQSYQIRYAIEAWEVGTELVNFLFPLFVTLPLCWNLYYERKDNFLFYVRPRVRIGNYLTAKWLAQAFCSFLILFIPYILSAVFVVCIAPIDIYVPEVVITPYNHAFLQNFTENPLLYASLLSLWKGMVGLLVMTLGFVLSMYVKNIFVILTGPFLYVVLENFIFAVLGLEKYRLIVSFEPTAIAPTAYDMFSALFGPFVLLIVIGIIWFYCAKIRKHTVITL